MMLSPRRFWCALFMCALLVGGLLIEPVQQYAKWLAVDCAFAGTVSVNDFKFHRNQELLEFSDLRTSQFDDSTEVNLTADRALVKLDMPNLLDKRFVSSRVKLQGVKLELASLPIQTAVAASTSTWQKSLDEAVAAFQWENLRNDCEAVLKSEDILNELNEKMRGWLLRSQQIMFHGDQLTRTIQGYSNPLRHQNEIRNQLDQLERLRAEQDSIQKQFSSVNAILANHLKGVQSLGEKDALAIREKFDRKATSLRNLTAEQIVSEWAKELVTRQLLLSQSFATLMPTQNRSNPYDVDVRNAASRTPAVSISGIEADGFLCDALKQIPFTATGEYASVQKADYRFGRNTAWKINFDLEQVGIQLDLTSVEADSAWTILSSCSESDARSAIDLTLADVGESDKGEVKTMLELDASMSGQQLSGKVRMNLAKYQAFSKLPCAGNADLGLTDLANRSAVPATASDEDWIEFTLSGTASAAQFVLASEIPTEFTNTITDSIQKRLETQRLDCESKLKVALSAKVDELGKQIEQVAKNGQQTVAKQCEALTAMHRELEQSLQSREGFEYARLPSKASANR